MPLPTHGRYDYSPIRGRKPYDWPNGTQLAIYVAVNVEHFAFGEGLGAELGKRSINGVSPRRVI